MLGKLKLAQPVVTPDSYRRMPVPQTHTAQRVKRMLLVEDQLSDVVLAENLMQDSMPDYGWDIIDRPSLAKAITMAGQFEFDLALVDLNLEDVSGPETVALLRAAAPQLPVIVYSGSSNSDMIRAALAQGAQFHIEKGKTEPRLVRAIIRCVLEPQFDI